MVSWCLLELCSDDTARYILQAKDTHEIVWSRDWFLRLAWVPSLVIVDAAVIKATNAEFLYSFSLAIGCGQIHSPTLPFEHRRRKQESDLLEEIYTRHVQELQ